MFNNYSIRLHSNTCIHTVLSARVLTPHNRSQHIQANTRRGFIQCLLTIGIMMPETCWINLLWIHIYTCVICCFFLFLTLHFSHDRSNWSSPSFSSTTFQNTPGVSDLLPEASKFQHHTKPCSKCSILMEGFNCQYIGYPAIFYCLLLVNSYWWFPSNTGSGRDCPIRQLWVCWSMKGWWREAVGVSSRNPNKSSRFHWPAGVPLHLASVSARETAGCMRLPQRWIWNMAFWDVTPCGRVNMYSKICLKRNAIVPVFFFSVSTGFRFTKRCVLKKQSTKNMIA